MGSPTISLYRIFSAGDFVDTGDPVGGWAIPPLLASAPTSQLQSAA